ncbi:MAG: hypothetical protein HY880_03845, partial [Deltaproteobacteria bacterium]|nr:hypothetical protein [Deltaproteobacteria bacterium]
MNNRTLQMMVVLTVTSILVGGVLAAVYLYAYPKIEANRLEDEKKAIFAVLKDAANYEIITKEIKTDKGIEAIRI